MKPEQQVASVINTAIEKVDNLFEATFNLISEGYKLYGQQTIDAVLLTVKLDALQELVSAWSLLILFSIVIYLLNKNFSVFGKRNLMINKKDMNRTILDIMSVKFQH